MSASLQGTMQRRHLKPFWEMQAAGLVAEQAQIRQQRIQLLAESHKLIALLDEAGFMANLSEAEFAQAYEQAGIEMMASTRQLKQRWQAEVERLEAASQDVVEQRRQLLRQMRELDERIQAARSTGEQPLDQLVELHQSQGMTVIGHRDQ